MYSKVFHSKRCLPRCDECARRPDSSTISRLHHHHPTGYTGGQYPKKTQLKGVKTSAFKIIRKTNRPWLELRTEEQDYHEWTWYRRSGRVKVIIIWILESVNTWKITRRGYRQGEVRPDVTPRKSVQGRSNVYNWLSGLDDVGFNDLKSRMISYRIFMPYCFSLL